MFALSITSKDILVIEMCETLTFSLEFVMVESKYANQKPRYDFLYADYSNVCFISRHF